MTLFLPAREFAVGWTNTSLAAGTNDGNPQLYRTTLIEVFDSGAVVLVSSDNSVLFTSAVADDLGNTPAIDEAPTETHVVIDRHLRMRNLMGWVLKNTKGDKGADSPPLRIEFRDDEHPNVPTLSPEMNKRVMVVDTERERLVLDCYDGKYFDWRKQFAGHTATPTESLVFSPLVLALLGKVKDTSSPVKLTLAGPRGGVKFSIEAEPLLQGVLMPCEPDGPTPTENAQQTELVPV